MVIYVFISQNITSLMRTYVRYVFPCKCKI